MANVGYTYLDADEAPTDTAKIARNKFGPITIILEQGQLIALQAKHRGGKTETLPTALFVVLTECNDQVASKPSLSC